MTSGLAFAVHIKEFETDKASSASKLKYGDGKVHFIGSVSNLYYVKPGRISGSFLLF